MNPFDYLNAINQTKIDIMKGDAQAQKDYNAFIINRGLSYFPDTVMFANEMNTHADIPKQWQFDFYRAGIVKKKRFSKWHKRDQDTDEVKLVMKEYNYSSEKAMNALSLLTSEQIKELKEKYQTGGR
jgi:NACalpha-BTF3-like transcription factor